MGTGHQHQATPSPFQPQSAEERGNWFLALPLPPAAGWQQAALPLPAGLQALHPEDLHLTLAFLGPCGPERAAAAWQALAGLRSPALTITAGPWRAFGSQRRPSAYGVSVEQGNAALTALMQRWAPLARLAAAPASSTAPPASGCTGPAGSAAAVASPSGRRTPQPPTLPHITLARPQRRSPTAEAGEDRLPAWLASAPRPAGPARLQELALYRWSSSRGTPGSPRFAIVRRRRLDDGHPPQLDAEV